MNARFSSSSPFPIVESFSFDDEDDIYSFKFSRLFSKADTRKASLYFFTPPSGEVSTLISFAGG